MKLFFQRISHNEYKLIKIKENNELLHNFPASHLKKQVCSYEKE